MLFFNSVFFSQDSQTQCNHTDLLKDNFVQNFYSDLNSPGTKENQGNKLRTYRKFKHSYEREKYLDIANFRYRRAMTKLRISDHPLEIEAGRYNRTPPDDRLCIFCDKSFMYVENEVHFVLECSLYKDLRNAFANATHIDKKYAHLTKENLFKYLMSSSNYDILEKLGKFVHACFKKREEACKL